jgi:hypothetical protein
MAQASVPPLEELQADLFFLMDHYTGDPCPDTANAIAQVLQGMLEHPLIDLFPSLRGHCARGLRHWRLRAATAGPQNCAATTLH